MVDGEIGIRPMMHLTHNCDYKIRDGREEVALLMPQKECIGDPQRVILDL